MLVEQLSIQITQSLLNLTEKELQCYSQDDIEVIKEIKASIGPKSYQNDRLGIWPPEESEKIGSDKKVIEHASFFPEESQPVEEMAVYLRTIRDMLTLCQNKSKTNVETGIEIEVFIQKILQNPVLVISSVDSDGQKNENQIDFTRFIQKYVEEILKDLDRAKALAADGDNEKKILIFFQELRTTYHLEPTMGKKREKGDFSPRYVLGKKLTAIKTMSESDMYIAWDMVTKKKVAIKIFRVGYSNHAFKEAAAHLAYLEAVSKSDMPQVHSCILMKLNGRETSAIVMEYKENVENIVDFLAKTRDITEKKEHLTCYLRSVSEILDRMRSLGIHNDLKPDNLMYDRTEKKAVVLDVGASPVAHKPAVDSVIGTRFFMTPEKMEQKPFNEVKEDIFGIAIILWEILTEELPFAEEGKNQVIEIYKRIRAVQVEEDKWKKLQSRLDSSRLLRKLEKFSEDKKRKLKALFGVAFGVGHPSAYSFEISTATDFLTYFLEIIDSE